jgi:hypothetical protein
VTNEQRRAKIRQGLSSLYVKHYDALCGLLPPEWAPYQGLRSIEVQAQLWKQGRVTPGPKITNAKPGQSPHNYGCASDWTIFEDGKPVWMTKDDPRWRVYANAIEKVGLRWGADWNMNGKIDDERFLDLPHNELPIDCSWTHVYGVFTKNGMRAAQEHIEKALKK